jgi:hypothetical protein
MLEYEAMKHRQEAGEGSMSDTPKCPCCLGSDTGYYGLSSNRFICHKCQCEWSESERNTSLERELAEARVGEQLWKTRWASEVDELKKQLAAREAGEVQGPWWCCRADFGKHEPTCKNHPNNRREAGEVGK